MQITNGMTVRKSLTSIILAGALALTGAGCSKHPEFDFNGKVGEEQVRFYESGIGFTNTLEVVKADGNKTIYTDFNDDFRLEYVQFTLMMPYGDTIKSYSRSSQDLAGREIVQKGQEEFDAYLTKIRDKNKGY